VKDLHFKNSSVTNSTLQKFEYGHDPLDQRVFARVTQRNANGTPSEDERSWHYGYDRLGRLVSADMGDLISGNTQVQASGLVDPVRDSDWTMDLLGNWVGDAQTSTPGRRTLGVPRSTGPPREMRYTDAVTRTNAITQRVTVDDGAGTTSNLNDAAGALVVQEGPTVRVQDDLSAASCSSVPEASSHREVHP
jgi:hypothetical protein